MRDPVAPLPPVVNIFDDRGTQPIGFIPPWPPNPGLVPGHVRVTVAPGPAPAVVIFAVPGLVIVSCPVNHRALILVGSLVARRVTDLDLVVRALIDVRESRVVHRRA